MSREADRLTLLRTFLCVADRGSLTGAALGLGVSQPTVSRRVQALEGSVGTPLFVRNVRPIRLTASGARLRLRAAEVVEGWDALDSDFGPVTTLSGDHVRAWVCRTIPERAVLAPLLEFLLAHPPVCVEWTHAGVDPDFDSEGIDCAVGTAAFRGPGLASIELGRVARIVAIAPGVLRGAAPAPDAAVLRRWPWVALSSQAEGIVLENGSTLESLSFRIDPRLVVDSEVALCAASAEGLGACVASREALEPYLLDGRLVQVLPGWRAEPVPVWLSYPRDRVSTALSALLSVFAVGQAACPSGVVGRTGPRSDRRAR